MFREAVLKLFNEVFNTDATPSMEEFIVEARKRGFAFTIRDLEVMYLAFEVAIEHGSDPNALEDWH